MRGRPLERARVLMASSNETFSGLSQGGGGDALRRRPRGLLLRAARAGGRSRRCGSTCKQRRTTSRVAKGARSVALVRGENTRARLQIYLYSKTRLGMGWDVLQAMLAILSCALYIKSTYDVECVSISAGIDVTIELVVFGFFLADYLLSFYLARDKLVFVLSPVAVADLLTILPTLLQLAFGLFHASDGCGESSFLFAKFVRLIRIMRVMRMIRVLRLGARISARADNVVHHVASVVTTLVTVIFVAALASSSGWRPRPRGTTARRGWPWSCPSTAPST